MMNNISESSYHATILYSAEEGYMVEVIVGYFDSEYEAKKYGYSANLKLRYVKDELVLLDTDEQINKRLSHDDIQVSRLKKESKGKASTTDSDYEEVSIRVKDFPLYNGLMRGFENIAHGWGKVGSKLRMLG